MSVAPDLARTLATVVDEGSLDAAAAALHLTQSAVSQRIAALERQVGQAVLIRSRPVRATAAGQAVIHFAREVSLLEDDLAHRIGGDGPTAPTVRLAANADSISSWLMPALARLATEHGMTVDLHREDESRTADLLARGDVAAAITTRAAQVAGSSSTPLGRMEYRAVAAPAFAERWFPAGLSPAALTRAPVVDFDANDDIQSRWLAQVAPSATPPRHRIPSSGEFSAAIRLSMGWGLMPPESVDPTSTGLVDLGGPVITVTLHWQRWRVRSELLDLVAHEVRDAASAVLLPA